MTEPRVPERDIPHTSYCIPADLSRVHVPCREPLAWILKGITEEPNTVVLVLGACSSLIY